VTTSPMTDGDGYLHRELPTRATGTLYIAVTDHRPDCGGPWDRLEQHLHPRRG
jgi:hypothetical protein